MIDSYLPGTYFYPVYHYSGPCFPAVPPAFTHGCGFGDCGPSARDIARLQRHAIRHELRDAWREFSGREQHEPPRFQQRYELRHPLGKNERYQARRSSECHEVTTQGSTPVRTEAGHLLGKGARHARRSHECLEGHHDAQTATDATFPSAPSVGPSSGAATGQVVRPGARRPEAKPSAESSPASHFWPGGGEAKGQKPEPPATATGSLIAAEAVRAASAAGMPPAAGPTPTGSLDAGDPTTKPAVPQAPAAPSPAAAPSAEEPAALAPPSPASEPAGPQAPAAPSPTAAPSAEETAAPAAPSPAAEHTAAAPAPPFLAPEHTAAAPAPPFLAPEHTAAAPAPPSPASEPALPQAPAASSPAAAPSAGEPPAPQAPAGTTLSSAAELILAHFELADTAAGINGPDQKVGEADLRALAWDHPSVPAEVRQAARTLVENPALLNAVDTANGGGKDDVILRQDLEKASTLGTEGEMPAEWTLGNAAAVLARHLAIVDVAAGSGDADQKLVLADLEAVVASPAAPADLRAAAGYLVENPAAWNELNSYNPNIFGQTDDVVGLPDLQAATVGGSNQT